MALPDLDDLLWTDRDDVVVLDGVGVDGQSGEPLGLPGEHLVGHPLEGLADKPMTDWMTTVADRIYGR